MRINLKKTLLVTGLVGLVAAPFVAKADGVRFDVKIGDDNEAHYHFRDRAVRHDPEMLRAAQSLAEAKNHIWYMKNDFSNHRARAIQHINMALDEISAAERSHWHDRR